ncbi:MAG: uroporphyrinogen-III synthase [Pseudomonadota bacterium]
MRPVLLTQAVSRSRRHAAKLAQHNIETSIWPLLEIAQTVDELPDIAIGQTVLLTSANAGRIIADLGAPRDAAILTVGDETAALMRGLGFHSVQSAGGTVDDLAVLARSSRYQRFVYVRGQDVARDLVSLIGEDRVDQCVVYTAKPSGPPPKDIEDKLVDGRFGAVSLWSRRNAEVFAEHLAANPGWQMKKTTAVAISTNAAVPLRNDRFQRVITPPQPDSAGMLKALVDLSTG